MDIQTLSAIDPADLKAVPIRKQDDIIKKTKKPLSLPEAWKLLRANTLNWSKISDKARVVSEQFIQLLQQEHFTFPHEQDDELELMKMKAEALKVKLLLLQI